MLPVRYPIYSIAILWSRYHFLHWWLKKPALRKVKSVPKDAIACVRLNQERNLGSVLYLLYPMPLHEWSHANEELTVKVCGIQQALKGETMKHRPSRGCSYGKDATWPFESVVLLPWAPNNTLKCGVPAHLESSASSSQTIHSNSFYASHPSLLQAPSAPNPVVGPYSGIPRSPLVSNTLLHFSHISLWLLSAPQFSALTYSGLLGGLSAITCIKHRA